MKKIITTAALFLVFIMAKAQSYNGVLTNTSSYFTIQPYNSSYDDGSKALFFYDGNQKIMNFWNSDSGTQYTSIQAGNAAFDGNVGIGTTSPSNKLEVRGGSTSLSNYVNIYDFDGGNTTSTLISRDGNTTFWNGGVVIGQYSNDVVGTLPSGNLVVKGNVLINKTTQTNPSYKLDVSGKIRANEIVVNTDGADFVFEEDYQLRPLEEVAQYIKENKHLPEIASATEMQEKGIGVSELQMQLLQKVEELTLYLLQQEKRFEEQEKENQRLINRIEKLEK